MSGEGLVKRPALDGFSRYKFINRSRRILSNAILPILSVLLVIGCRFGRRYGRWTLGQCSFYGPKNFLTECSKAMDLLRELDIELYNCITSRRLMCWYEPGGFPFLTDHCPISESFFRWGVHGIIASVIFSYFKTKIIGLSPRTSERETFLVISRELRLRVRTWLQAKAFPQQLINAFGDTASNGTKPNVG